MEQRRREALATKRAEEYAPMPEGGALMAGACGAVVAWLGDVAVSAFYGWRLVDHIWISVLVPIAGFLVGFVAHRRLARISRKARRAELAKIELDEDGSAGSPPSKPV